MYGRRRVGKSELTDNRDYRSYLFLLDPSLVEDILQVLLKIVASRALAVSPAHIEGDFVHTFLRRDLR